MDGVAYRVAVFLGGNRFVPRASLSRRCDTRNPPSTSENPNENDSRSCPGPNPFRRVIRCDRRMVSKTFPIFSPPGYRLPNNVTGWVTTLFRGLDRFRFIFLLPRLRTNHAIQIAYYREVSETKIPLETLRNRPTISIVRFSSFCSVIRTNVEFSYSFLAKTMNRPTLNKYA